jgi:purine-binding chemotaxis protein CheW
LRESASAARPDESSALGKWLHTRPAALHNRWGILGARAAQFLRTSEVVGRWRAGRAGAMNDTAGRAPQEFLIFELGGRRYGLPVTDVREIVRAVAPVPLPGAPALVEGFINIRGSVVPVLDLRRRFRLPVRPLEPSDQLVVARAAGRFVALRVDRALDLVRLAAADVDEVEGAGADGQSAARVAKLPGDLVLIQDLRALLSRAESAALDEALPADGGERP